MNKERLIPTSYEKIDAVLGGGISVPSINYFSGYGGRAQFAGLVRIIDMIAANCPVDLWMLGDDDTQDVRRVLSLLSMVHGDKVRYFTLNNSLIRPQESSARIVVICILSLENELVPSLPILQVLAQEMQVAFILYYNGATIADPRVDLGALNTASAARFHYQHGVVIEPESSVMAPVPQLVTEEVIRKEGEFTKPGELFGLLRVINVGEGKSADAVLIPTFCENASKLLLN